MRDAILGMLEGLATVAVIAMTALGFLMGGFAGGINPFGGSSFSIVGALIGGGVGFLGAVLSTGILFLLLSMNESLQQQTAQLDALRRQMAAGGAAQGVQVAYVAPVAAASQAPAGVPGYIGSSPPPARAAVTAGQNECPTCGERNPPGARYCAACSGRLRP